MSITELTGEKHLNETLQKKEGSAIIGFFGDFSEVSRKTESEFRRFAEKIDALKVDVGRVKSLHRQFGVTSVPTVVQVKDGRVINRVSGHQTADYYTRAFLKNSPVASSAEGGRPAMPPVTVWTSSSCPWCTRVKTYLRKQHVPFTEINISTDPSAAESLRARTGQTGVPQLSIGGRFVVGFDKQKIDGYLGLEQ